MRFKTDGQGTGEAPNPNGSGHFRGRQGVSGGGQLRQQPNLTRHGLDRFLKQKGKQVTYRVMGGVMSHCSVYSFMWRGPACFFCGCCFDACLTACALRGWMGEGRGQKNFSGFSYIIRPLPFLSWTRLRDWHSLVQGGRPAAKMFRWSGPHLVQIWRCPNFSAHGGG